LAGKGSGSKRPARKRAAGKGKNPRAARKTAPETRLARGKARDDARFTAAPPITEVPAAYASTLAEIKQRLKQARLRTVLAANASLVLTYWEIGHVILERQQSQGWGGKCNQPALRGSPRGVPRYAGAFAA
jgi:hypothetical protein